LPTLSLPESITVLVLFLQSDVGGEDVYFLGGETAANTSLIIYDQTGRQVASRRIAQGETTLELDLEGHNLGTELYFVVLSVGKHNVSERLVFVN
jgi:hypothetical protein